jgi:competence protein ComEA
MCASHKKEDAMYRNKEEKNKFTRWMAALVLAVFFAGALSCGQKKAVVLELSPDAGDQTETSQEAVLETKAAPKPEAIVETDSGGMIQVHVCGAVRTSGVYSLPAGSRVFEAVEAAGGMAADAAVDYLNLADVVLDKAKVRVPFLSELSGEEVYGEDLAFGMTGGGNHVSSEDSGKGQNLDGLVDLNHADRETLMSLPGIGEAKAEALIDWREKQGFFEKPEDIMQVPGIKEAAYEKLKDKITVKN